MQAHSLRKLLTLVCSVLLAVGLSASAAVAEQQHRAQSSSSFAKTHDVRFYSNDDFVKAFGVKKALAFNIPLPADTSPAGVLSPQDPPQPWYKIDWATKDWNGRDIPTRHGDSNFGFVHACDDHSMCAEKPMTAPYHGYPDKWTSSTRAEYYGVVVIDNEPTIKITSVAEFGHSGPNGAAPPDGRAIGTVTSYCQGMTYCPYWINV